MPTVSERVDDLIVKSKIGTRRQRDHFQAGDAPLHEVMVENRTGEECYVVIEISTESSIVLIDGVAGPWRSHKMKHGGLRSHIKREWPYQATLSFTGAAPRRPQNIEINIYMAAAWWPDNQPLPLIGAISHMIWIR